MLKDMHALIVYVGVCQILLARFEYIFHISVYFTCCSDTATLIPPKYTQHHDLARKLKATHPAPLIEGTIDSLWGGGLHCDSVGYDENDFHGKNVFGSILADIRTDLLQRT